MCAHKHNHTQTHLRRPAQLTRIPLWHRNAGQRSMYAELCGVTKLELADFQNDEAKFIKDGIILVDTSCVLSQSMCLPFVVPLAQSSTYRLLPSPCLYAKHHSLSIDRTTLFSLARRASH
jgi:hypothetical protein